MVTKLVVVCALAAAGACGSTPPQVVYVSSQANAGAAVGAGDGDPASADDTETTPTPTPAPAPSVMAPSGREVVVLVDKRVDRPTEVLGVFDFHTAATSQDKGFEELKVRAAALGADAVIGAEFEHGDDGGPSHLSGMAVRFLDH